MDCVGPRSLEDDNAPLFLNDLNWNYDFRGSEAVAQLVIGFNPPLVQSVVWSPADCIP